MALSEQKIREEMLLQERQKTKLLADIRDLLGEIAKMRLVELSAKHGILSETVSGSKASLELVFDRINERWSE